MPVQSLFFDLRQDRIPGVGKGVGMFCHSDDPPGHAPLDDGRENRTSWLWYRVDGRRLIRHSHPHFMFCIRYRNADRHTWKRARVFMHKSFVCPTSNPRMHTHVVVHGSRLRLQAGGAIGVDDDAPYGVEQMPQVVHLHVPVSR
eukprot:3525395-Pyramimonas_sp.AAC.1